MDDTLEEKKDTVFEFTDYNNQVCFIDLNMKGGQNKFLLFLQIGFNLILIAFEFVITVVDVFTIEPVHISEKQSKICQILMKNN